MKLAVTGCNGRVGRRVAKVALERGNEVLGIDEVPLPATTQYPWFNSPIFKFKQVDLQDFETVMEVLAGCDAVINLAACPDPGDYKVKTHNKYEYNIWTLYADGALILIV